MLIFWQQHLATPGAHLWLAGLWYSRAPSQAMDVMNSGARCSRAVAPLASNTGVAVRLDFSAGGKLGAHTGGGASSACCLFTCAQKRDSWGRDGGWQSCNPAMHWCMHTPACRDERSWRRVPGSWTGRRAPGVLAACGASLRLAGHHSRRAAAARPLERVGWQRLGIGGGAMARALSEVHSIPQCGTLQDSVYVHI